MTDAPVVDRPLMAYWWPQLQTMVDERYDDPAGLQEILGELLFRRRAKALRLREIVVERLVELSNDGFLWPTTAAPGGDGFLIGEEWPQIGMLAFLGYHVGQNGVRTEDRRAFLDFAYTERLPLVNNADYMQRWSTPRSARWLQQIAESLAAFCRNNKRKHPSALCIVDWEADLEYLRANYYRGHYDFSWPSTELA